MHRKNVQLTVDESPAIKELYATIGIERTAKLMGLFSEASQIKKQPKAEKGPFDKFSNEDSATKAFRKKLENGF